MIVDDFGFFSWLKASIRFTSDFNVSAKPTCSILLVSFTLHTIDSDGKLIDLFAQSKVRPKYVIKSNPTIISLLLFGKATNCILQIRL